MPKTLKRTIRGYRFEWQGGPHIEITRVGESYPFEVVNVTREDGTLPPFNPAEFAREISDFRTGLNDEQRRVGGRVSRGSWIAELTTRARDAYDR